MDHLAFLMPIFNRPMGESWITMVIDVVQKRDAEDHPINGADVVSSYETDNPKLIGHSLRDLIISAQASVTGQEDWYAIRVEYRNANTVDAKRARAMVKTLTAIEKAAEKLRDKQGLDYLTAILLAFDKVFPGMQLAETSEGGTVRGFYNRHKWRWTPIGGAVRAIRSSAEEALVRHRKEKAA
ncbi:hypothetical protein KEU06_09385 [Pseudaminobacter sp. 19-2017]|uniref:Uncharacterized protein n=1 Tax=Pseudaminobacter soli (ex Zhang et al. 2022) TaxID=2831468 RepID=A0A942DXH1_9HYPH|nr:hypothetical protein [Pseudaminobacter soli]MBS3648817.1 hypothetical protein [Pseudaminobacter soli]